VRWANKTEQFEENSVFKGMDEQEIRANILKEIARMERRIDAYRDMSGSCPRWEPRILASASGAAAPSHPPGYGTARRA
jgi:hypothetical protein